jgi:GT2 family glycosyltransferase
MRYKSVEISIIIVNYNGQKWLPGCLRSIENQTFNSFEVIIIDNNSTDNSLSIIKKYCPHAKIIKSVKNTGFGVANNIGAKKAKGRYQFFLNTDTVLTPNCLKEMHQQVTSKGIDLAGPKILDFKNNDFYHSRKLTLDIVGNMTWGKSTLVIEGCALLIKTEVFNHLGGFDKSFFMYSEDLDLCWRAWMYGYNIKTIDTAKLKHFGGGSSTPTMISSGNHVVPVFRRYETEKNTLRMMLKNATIGHLVIALPIIILLLIGESVIYLLTNQLPAAKIIFKSLTWNIKHFQDTILKRRVIRRKSSHRNVWPLLAKKITKIEVFKLIGIPKIKV